MKQIVLEVEDEVYAQWEASPKRDLATLAALSQSNAPSIVHQRMSPEEHARFMAEWGDLLANLQARNPGLSAADNLSREELYDRHAVR